MNTTTEGVSSMSAEVCGQRLTNPELADAIQAAWLMQHQTGRMSANHGDITTHLAALLKEQRKRAELA